mmetsp:Transcript_19358/g.57424  ORF Transcript_19358/g.57424 Transcript_19358/m.57424 type:complete len:227 (-) Transcript_19358:571-1251(-)
MIAARNRACVGRSPLGMPSSMLACRNARRTAGRQAADRAVQASAAGSNQAASAKMLAAGAALTLALAGPVHAEKLAEFTGSGFLFRDNIEVTVVDDEGVAGVTIYLSDFKRSLADKLKKDFFSEPSQASLTCAVTGPVTIKDTKAASDPSGVEIFSEKKSFNLFQDKTLRIRRIYDSKRNTVLYVAYSTRLSSAADDGAVSTGRYRTSLCAVRLPDPVAPPTSAVE